MIVPRTIFLLRQSGHILLEGSPRDVDLSSLRQKLRDTPGVAGVHDVHLWTLTSGMNSASAHIRAAPGWRSDDVLSAAQKLFEEQAGISHATIQVEATPEAECPDTAKHP